MSVALGIPTIPRVVCIDFASTEFVSLSVVADAFHVIADANVVG